MGSNGDSNTQRKNKKSAVARERIVVVELEMFLRSKVQEMILRRRSRSMNSSSGGGALAGQHATSSPAASPCDGSGAAGAGKRAFFGSPRLLHCASLPSGGGAEPEAAYSMNSPTSVLDAAAFAPSPDAAAAAGIAGGKRRPWCDGGGATHGLADALDSTDDGVLKKPLLRSCSLDRRVGVEFGVKNKSSWLPLRSAAGDSSSSPAAAASSPTGEIEIEMEPSSEDYTCVISRGPNPRTVHIFGDRVVEGLAAVPWRSTATSSSALVGVGGVGGESSPRPINLPAPAPAREARGFLSL
uniref:Uncharacterized protein n=1 Tax=Leersia perrieri TaxID=77586 RepID=A0A0D9VYX7_9ORYZ